MHRVKRLSALAKPVVTALVVSPFVSDHLVLRTLFSRQGWVLDSAFTFQEALHLLREETIPVVICQRNLQDGDWRTLAEQSQQLRRPVKVIVASKAAEATLVMAVAEAGAFGVLFTPFDLQEVERLILLAWTSSQFETEVAKARPKAPSRVGPTAEQSRSKHATS